MASASVHGSDLPARSGARIPTAIEQRLEWKPTVGRVVFRTKSDFLGLVNSYMFATGKRYTRDPTQEKNRRRVVLRCNGCEEGRLEIHHVHTSRANHWCLMGWELCECQSAAVPAVLGALKKEGVLSLANQNDVVETRDWELLASACFPAGYSASGPGKSVRMRPCRCSRKGCPGMVELRVKRRGNSLDDDGPVHVQNVVECSQQCKEMGNSRKQTIPAPDPPTEEVCCELCYDTDEPSEWYRFKCGKHVCRDCLGKLVATCPQEIAQSRGSLVVFAPEKYGKKHSHICPYCRDPYYPLSKLVKSTKGGPQGPDSWSYEEVRLESVIPTAFAYQSFSESLADTKSCPARLSAEQLKAAKDLPAALTAQKYRDVALPLYRIFRVAEAEARGSPDPLQTVLGVLRAVEADGYQRLHILKQSNACRRHRHPVLNFLDAVELLHDQNLDYGYLQRVADAATEKERRLLINEAYVNGYQGTGSVDYHLVVALLLEKKLVEVTYVD